MSVAKLPVISTSFSLYFVLVFIFLVLFIIFFFLFPQIFFLPTLASILTLAEFMEFHVAATQAKAING